MWRFKRYVSEDGDQVRDWYEQQTLEVKANVYGIIDATAREDEAPYLTSLTGQYDGLAEVEIFIRTPRGMMRTIGLIGFWEPDSPNFIAVLCAEIDGNNLNTLLQRALRYKAEWQAHRGDVYDLFDDEDAQELIQ